MHNRTAGTIERIHALPTETKETLKRLYNEGVKTREIARRMTSLGYTTITGREFLQTDVSNYAFVLGCPRRRAGWSKQKTSRKVTRTETTTKREETTDSGFISAVMRSNLPETYKQQIVYSHLKNMIN